MRVTPISELFQFFAVTNEHYPRLSAIFNRFVEHVSNGLEAEFPGVMTVTHDTANRHFNVQAFGRVFRVSFGLVYERGTPLGEVRLAEFVRHERDVLEPVSSFHFNYNGVSTIRVDDGPLLRVNTQEQATHVIMDQLYRALIRHSLPVEAE